MGRPHPEDIEELARDLNESQMEIAAIIERIGDKWGDSGSLALGCNLMAIIETHILNNVPEEIVAAQIEIAQEIYGNLGNS